MKHFFHGWCFIGLARNLINWSNLTSIRQLARSDQLVRSVGPLGQSARSAQCRLQFTSQNWSHLTTLTTPSSHLCSRLPIPVSSQLLRPDQINWSELINWPDLTNCPGQINWPDLFNWPGLTQLIASSQLYWHWVFVFTCTVGVFEHHAAPALRSCAGVIKPCTI